MAAVSVREEIIGDARLFCGDCREVLPTLSDVNAVVTSPPYWQQRDYGGHVTDWNATVAVLAETAPMAQVLVNLGLLHRNGEVFEYWDVFKVTMKNAGWKLFGWYVWDKGGIPPSGDQAHRPLLTHEWVFHFNKLPQSINKWVPSKNSNRSVGLRDKDGSFKPIIKGRINEFKAPDTVLRIPAHNAAGGSASINHPAVFPVLLPEQLARSFSKPGETVLDPFMGSGTTGVACARLGRKFIGVEIEERYFSIACKRIEQAYRQADLFVPRVARKPAPEPSLFPGV